MKKEIRYRPNQFWLLQVALPLIILTVLGYYSFPDKDPMKVALVFIFVMLFIIFLLLARAHSLKINQDVLELVEPGFRRELTISDIERIEKVTHGIWGHTDVVSGKQKITINHSLFDRKTRDSIERDLINYNPKIQIRSEES